MQSSRLMGAVSIGALVLFSMSAEAKDKKPKAASKQPQDEIAVVGHVPLVSGPVTRFLITQHYSSAYLYAEHGEGKSVTLIDVTKVAQPAVLADMPYPADAGSGSLFVVAGTAAVVGAGQPAVPTTTAPQTIRIMDFSNPQHPKVGREFAGVTAISRDDRRGLIFVANGEGIWILKQSLAMDPAIEDAYAHYVLFNR
jgi:hypothetical protein